MSTQAKINKELDWLKTNAKYLSIKSIEKEVGCPSTTIQQFIGKAERNIPDKWIVPIVEWIKKFKQYGILFFIKYFSNCIINFIIIQGVNILFSCCIFTMAQCIFNNRHFNSVI
jgi:hypothetical protein